MTTFAEAGYISDDDRTQADGKTYHENLLAGIKSMPGGSGAQTLTIASDAISPAAETWLILLLNQGGAANDDLKTINTTNIRDGQLLFLTAGNAAQAPRVFTGGGGSGQIVTAKGAHLTPGTKSMVVVRWDLSTTSWKEVFHSEDIDNPTTSAAAKVMATPAGTTGAATLISLAREHVDPAVPSVWGWKASVAKTLASDVVTPSATDPALLTLTSESSTTDNCKALDNTDFVTKTFTVMATSGHTITLKHQQSVTGNQRRFLLARGVDAVLSGNRTVTFAIFGTDCVEVARAGFIDSSLAGQPFEARLTLISGDPFGLADASAVATLRLSPINGGRVSTSDSGGNTTITQLTGDITLSLASILANVIYDVWVLDPSVNSGSIGLELLAWKKVTASNSPTSGSSKTINISDTTGIANGSVVTVRDGSNNQTAVVSSFVTNTSITVASLATSFTTPDVYFPNTRATDVTRTNGTWYKDGDITRRYAGTLRGSAGGQCSSTNATRFLWNCHNRVPLRLYATDTTDTWTLSSDNWRAANNNTTAGVGRTQFVIGLAEVKVKASYTTSNDNSGTGLIFAAGLALDSTTTSVVVPYVYSTYAAISKAEFSWTPSIGFHFIQSMEHGHSSGFTNTFQGDGGGTIPYSWQEGELAA